MTVTEAGLIPKLVLLLAAVTRVSVTVELDGMVPLALNSRVESVTIEPFLKQPYLVTF